jgi:ribosomal protein S18 acetylase RimI-like enzyme
MDYRIRDARVEDAEAIARVHVDSWRTTYRGIVPQEFLDSLSYEGRAQNWRAGLANKPQPQESWRRIGDIALVGEDPAGRIVGFANGGAIRGDHPPYDGELYSIYLLQEHQGKGLGRRLFVLLAQRLQAAGYRSMLLWALKDNPACRFYEGLGGVVAFEVVIDIAGNRLDEVAYGWPDLVALAAKG